MQIIIVYILSKLFAHLLVHVFDRFSLQLRFNRDSTETKTLDMNKRPMRAKGEEVTPSLPAGFWINIIMYSQNAIFSTPGNFLLATLMCDYENFNFLVVTLSKPTQNSNPLSSARPYAVLT